VVGNLKLSMLVLFTGDLQEVETSKIVSVNLSIDLKPSQDMGQWSYPLINQEKFIQRKRNETNIG